MMQLSSFGDNKNAEKDDKHILVLQNLRHQPFSYQGGAGGNGRFTTTKIVSCLGQEKIQLIQYPVPYIPFVHLKKKITRPGEQQIYCYKYEMLMFMDKNNI